MPWQADRYRRFHSALTAVNARLTGVYAQLTGGQGDAYCSYTEDAVAAFADGVNFHVRCSSWGVSCDSRCPTV